MSPLCPRIYTARFDTVGFPDENVVYGWIFLLYRGVPTAQHCNAREMLEHASCGSILTRSFRWREQERADELSAVARSICSCPRWLTNRRPRGSRSRHNPTGRCEGHQPVSSRMRNPDLPLPTLSQALSEIASCISYKLSQDSKNHHLQLICEFAQLMRIDIDAYSQPPLTESRTPESDMFYEC